MPRTTGTLAIVAIAFAALLPSAHAGMIQSIYVFGDSLSDAGNISVATLGLIPGSPYVNGQFSNGPVAVQRLAAGLGVAPLAPSLLGGTDYAYGSGGSGPTLFHAATQLDVAGPQGQLAQFQATHATADPNALYVIWIGANDLGDIPANATLLQVQTVIGQIVGNIDSAIVTLAGSGAKDFLIVTTPDLGKNPRALANGPVASATASAVAQAFNSTLVYGSNPIPSLAAIAAAGNLNLSVLDTYSLLDQIVANPAPYGFTNVTDPCVTGAIQYVGGTACAATLAAQNKYLFWDDLHPTAAANVILGNAALGVVTPEPASLSLLFVSVVGFYLKRRRRA